MSYICYVYLTIHVDICIMCVYCGITCNLCITSNVLTVV